MSDKCGIIVINGGRCVEQNRPQILLDVADFACVLLHAAQNEFNVRMVKLQKLRFDKLGMVVIAGYAQRLSCGADRFKNEVYNLINPITVKAVALFKNVIVDIVLDDLPINLYRAFGCRFFSISFRRLCRIPIERKGL